MWLAFTCSRWVYLFWFFSKYSLAAASVGSSVLESFAKSFSRTRFFERSLLMT
jgi:hypothetical protein